MSPAKDSRVGVRRPGRPKGPARHTICFRNDNSEHELFVAVVFDDLVNQNSSITPQDVNLSDMLRELVKQYVEHHVATTDGGEEALLHRYREATAKQYREAAAELEKVSENL